MSRRLWLVSVLFLVLSCAYVTAQSDGNIDVSITKLDTGFSVITLILIGFFILFALVIAVIMLIRRKRPRLKIPKPAEKINLGSVQDAGFRREGYYGTVFKNPISEKSISDEKSTHVEFISGDGSYNDVNRYLKEDERILINVLRMKHNSCSQATLRVVTDFSKAKLSRLLTELEERGVVYKKQQGRKNIITLREY